MEEERKLVSLNDIKCEEIVKVIKDMTKIVFKFRECVNLNLQGTHLEEPKILIERSNINTFKDDGNTYTPGYEYKVYWVMPYIEYQQRIENILYSDDYMWPSYMMFFALNITERIEDNRCKDCYFFHIFITDDGNNRNSKIETYNSNYPLDTLLLLENIYNAISIINKAHVKWKKKCEIAEKLKDIKVEINVQDYISSNTIK